MKPPKDVTLGTVGMNVELVDENSPGLFIGYLSVIE